MLKSKQRQMNGKRNIANGSCTKEDNSEEYDKFYVMYRRLYTSLKNDFANLTDIKI